MDLATCQRKLLGLFRNTHLIHADEDAYIRAVAQSKQLAEGRRNIYLWRVYVLERTCTLTVNLLRRRKLLEETLEVFIMQQNISPFRETQGPAFLERLSQHDDRLIASVAQFELALMKVRQGDTNSYVIPWNVEPHEFLHSLACNIPFAENIPAGDYEIVVSGDVPGQFRISQRFNHLLPD
jgi:hypothetical protein